MTARRLQVVLDLDTGRYTGRLGQAGSQMRAFGGTVNQSSTAVRQMGRSFDGLNASMQTPLQKLRDYVLILGNIRLAILNVRDIAVGWVGSLLKQSAEVERLTVLMQGLSTATTEMGKSKEAQENLRKLMTMARTSGFAVQALADSFVKIKSGGMDPMNGSLEGLVDAVSKFGGTSDVMHRASIAIQQMSGKGVISMEELRQQLGEAVPTAMTDMARAAGMTVKKFTKLVGDGVVQAKPALQLMLNEFTRMYSGAGERLANTLNGQISQFKTNMLELSTAFTELGKENGDGQGGGLFQGSIDAMAKINAAMRTSEAKQVVAEIGSSVNTVLQALISTGAFIIKFRDEFGVALKTVATLIVAVKATQFGAWLIGLSRAAVVAGGGINGAFAGAAGPMSSLVAKADEVSQAISRVQRVSEARVVHLGRMGQASQAQVASLTNEAQRLQQLSQDYSHNKQILDRHKIASAAALAQGQASGRYRDYETKQFVSQARAIEIHGNVVKASTRNRAAGAAVSRQLAQTEAVLSTAVNATTTAQTRAAAASVAAARAAGVAAGASRAAAIAVGFLGRAINMALGPVGMIALVLYTAAEAAGVFENKADRATAAAARMMQGISDAEAMKDVAVRRDQLRKEQQARAAKYNSGGTLTTIDDGAGRQTEAFVKFGPRQLQAMRKQETAAREEYVRLGRASRRGQAAIERDGVNQSVEAIRTEFETKKATWSGEHSNFVQMQRQKLDAGKITDAQFKVTTDASSAKFDAKATGWYKGLTAQISVERAAMVAAGKDVKLFDQFLGKIGEQAEQVGAQFGGDANSLRAGILGVDDATGKSTKKLTDAEKAAKKAATAFENAREKYVNMLGGNAGELAELQAEIDGGDKALAKFMAKVNAGMFSDALPAEIAQIAESFRKLDEAQGNLDFKRSMGTLERDLARAKSESTQLWASLSGGTFVADQRLAQVQARFANLFEGVTDPAKIEQIKSAISGVVAGLEQIDAADVSFNWEQQALEMEAGLLQEDQARQLNFEREVARQRAMIDWAKLSAEQRIQAEARFDRWRTAAQERLIRENQGSTARMARDWAQLGQNIDGALSGALNSFVEGMFDAEFSFEDFTKGLVKQLLKIILQAMIAYAILSALGMAPTNAGDGSKMSMGQFMKGQIGSSFGAGGSTPTAAVGTSHKGGLMGRAGSAIINASAFTGAKEHHNGGWIGGRQLKPGEVPIVGLDEELVLTKDQQKLLGQGLAAGGGGSAPAGAPNVEVNIINNSGTQLDAEEGEPEFNGKDMILNVVIEAAQQQGKLRDVLSEVGRRG